MDIIIKGDSFDFEIPIENFIIRDASHHDDLVSKTCLKSMKQVLESKYSIVVSF